MNAPRFAVFVLGAALLVSHRARADDASNARASFEPPSDSDALVSLGVDARKAGDDQKALELFQRALAIKSTPRVLAQIGLAEQALGRWVEAEAHLQKSLEATDDTWVSAHRETLDGALAEIGHRIGSLEITSNVVGAEVFVDGEARGRTPLAAPLRLMAGSYSIELRHTGFYPASRRVQIDAGRVERDIMNLSAASVEPAGAATGGVRPLPSERAPTSPESDGGNSAGTRFGTAKWLTLAGSGVLLVTAGATLLIHEGRVSAYNEDADCPGTASSAQPGKCDSRVSSGTTFGTISAVTAVVGAALGITSGALFVLDEPRRNVACTPGEHPLSLACFARF